MPPNEEEPPITGMCIVSNPEQCPHEYEVLLRSRDKQEDCDLWKDSFFRSKVTRYLCFTRVYPLDGGRLNNVLGDIIINNERDPPPPGFSLIDFTIDTREKATRKRQICVRMLPRATTTDAICDLIIHSRNKRPPIGYTLVGEINGLLLCYKMGAVPSSNGSPSKISVLPSVAPNTSFDFAEWANSLRQSEQTSSSSGQQGWWSYHSPYSTYEVPWASPPTNTQYSLNPTADMPPPEQHTSPKQHVQRQDSLLIPGAALEGVPFSLNARFLDSKGLSLNNVPEIHYRSRVDIDNEYSYNFRLERSAASRLTGMQ